MNAKVLLIEDDNALRELLSQALEMGDFEVVACANAEAALKVLTGDIIPDLVITDVNLPRVTGFEIVRFIRQSELDICVFLMTADQVASHAPEIELADMFFMKPLNIFELIEMAKRFTRHIAA